LVLLLKLSFNFVNTLLRKYRLCVQLNSSRITLKSFALSPFL